MPRACRTQLLAVSYQSQGAGWCPIIAGAFLGISTGLLWSAQGAIMMTCPLEKDTVDIREDGLSAVSTSTHIHFASWISMLVSFLLVYLVLRTFKETDDEDEQTV
ncbi:hypothetical protein BD310DRAFT_939506 [Dichomitus squalens]|uniref:Uncharacterized protein n=1 Tax=Dichomitus squalens TaxID=114155 RepID=A0A4Q9PD31_9APHY|nr:hypothetical protein BD310DRAFT_939506 [Dichomitus squalens]